MGRRRKKKRRISWRTVLLSVIVCAMAGSIIIRWSGRARRVEMPGEPFRIEVLNGTGETGLAMKTRMELLRMGVDVLGVGDAERFDFTESILIDRRGNRDVVEKFAKMLGCRRVIVQVRERAQVDATLILGTDADRLRLSGG